MQKPRMTGNLPGAVYSAFRLQKQTG